MIPKMIDAIGASFQSMIWGAIGTIPSSCR